MGKSKLFSCDNCGVDFRVTVEPGYPKEVVEKEFPRSVYFLKKIGECPVCGNYLTEKEE